MAAGSPQIDQMLKRDFADAVDTIQSQDPRFAREAYFFLRDGLDFTIKLRKKHKDGSTHVTGPQLLDGLRQFALKEYGPMVPTVFAYWGVSRCEDFGEMVFNLIDAGIFGKTDQDSIDDFKGGYSFHEAFVAPYVPEIPAVYPRLSAGQPAEKLS
jgi:uncharacterized repeat protein (TIGR04138 family)